MRRLEPPGSILLLVAHLNIIVEGPFKLFGKNYIEGALASWINIIVGGHLNRLVKIKLRGPGPWINIIVNYCCTRVLL